MEVAAEAEGRAGNAIIALCEIPVVERGCVFIELRVAILEE